MLTEAYEEDWMPHARVFEWYKIFRKDTRTRKTVNTLDDLLLQKQKKMFKNIVRFFVKTA